MSDDRDDNVVPLRPQPDGFGFQARFVLHPPDHQTSWWTCTLADEDDEPLAGCNGAGHGPRAAVLAALQPFLDAVIVELDDRFGVLRIDDGPPPKSPKGA